MPEQRLSDHDLDRLLDTDEATSEGNALAIFARIHERRRKRAHAKAKAEQPTLGLSDLAHDLQIDGTLHQEVEVCPCNDCLLMKLRASWSKPLDGHDFEAGPGAMDYLLQTVQDTLEAGDVEDAIFAMLRVARKAWAWNATHLGPIEGFPKQEQEK